MRVKTGYGDGVLSDARIAAMSPAERRDLIQRLHQCGEHHGREGGSQNRQRP
jgi:hypothetical protein